MHYTATAKLLHWLMAALLFGLLALGFYMHDLPLSPTKLQIYSWHKWAGVTAFLLVSFRLFWRLTHRPPALPESMPRLMQFAAHAGHLLLYVLMVAIPLSGWLMSSAKGFQTVYFGILPIPDLLDKNKELGDLLALVHKSLNLLFVAVLAGHIGAALKHHFIDKDDILIRMAPATPRRIEHETHRPGPRLCFIDTRRPRRRIHASASR
jgi:cytochrome b561